MEEGQGPNYGIPLEDLRALRESNDRLIEWLSKKEELSAVAVNSNNNTVTSDTNHWIAVWICTMCCAVTLTVVLLGKLDQTDQGRKIDRLQDHETVILQYAPELRSKINEMEKKK